MVHPTAFAGPDERDTTPFTVELFEVPDAD